MSLVGCTSNMCWELQAMMQPDPRSFSSFVCTSCQSDPPLCMDNFSFFMPKCITLHLFTLKVNCHSLSVCPSQTTDCQTCLVKLIGDTVHNCGIVCIHVYKGSNHIRHIINVTDEKHWPQHRTPWHSTENFNPGWEHAFNYHLLTSWR